MKFTYLIVDLATISVPFLFSFHPRLRFDRHFKAFFAANFISAFIFLLWDSLFTHWGVWGFSDKYTIGFRIAGMPIEELLFFICIPFACIYTYHCLGIFYRLKWKADVFRNFLVAFCSLLLIVGVYFIDRAYTSVTFISTALFLLFLHFIMKVQWLDKIFSVYGVLLIPFLVVNGILTGTGLESPVVWYNDNENMGIRLLTIPIEDSVYGFELIVLTLLFYETFRARAGKK